MTIETTLFDGTWAGALQHADAIPQERHVRIIDAEPSSKEVPARIQTLVEEFLTKVEALKDVESAETCETPPEGSDPYGEALEEKYRRMGFRFL